MAMRGRAVHKNYNPTLYNTEVSPINHFFIMVACHSHILESTKGIEIKLGTCKWEKVQKTKNIILSYILLKLSLFNSFHESGFHVMSWCTSSVWLQVLPFIDNMHLGSIPHFQRIPCLILKRWNNFGNKSMFMKFGLKKGLSSFNVLNCFL